MTEGWGRDRDVARCTADARLPPLAQKRENGRRPRVPRASGGCAGVSFPRGPSSSPSPDAGVGPWPDGCGLRPLERGRDAIPVGADTCFSVGSPRGTGGGKQVLAWLTTSNEDIPPDASAPAVRNVAVARAPPSRPPRRLVRKADRTVAAYNLFGAFCQDAMRGLLSPTSRLFRDFSSLPKADIVHV